MVHLLCSDGLTKHVTDEKIAERLGSMTTAKQVCEQLLQDARFGDVEMRAGVIPGLGALNVPNIGMLRSLAHTRFFIARKP